MSSVDRAWSTEHPGPSQADFVLGDRDGSTADPRLTRRIERFLQSRGFTVCVNPPGKGVEIVRRQGRPQVRRHSIQLEINKCLYLDEKSLTRLPQFNRMQNLLRELALMLLGMDRITL